MRSRIRQKASGQPVVCYCHYCLEGLKLGGADATPLVSLLFP